MKKFHLGDILSITTGRLVSPRLIDGVYDILNFMTGDSLFTHQLGRASDECKSYLLMQFPQLGNVDASTAVDDWEEWLNKQVLKYGKFLDVEPIPKSVHTAKDPLIELAEMVGDRSRIVPIVVDAKEQCK